jgi:hypothetical protein
MGAYDLDGKGGSRGCFVTFGVAFVLTLLSVAIAVGVGIIVYFAGPVREVSCQCNWAGPDPTPGGGNTPDHAQLVQQCRDLAGEGEDDICKCVLDVPGFVSCNCLCSLLKDF